jgi:hypothetical protein
MEGTNYASSVVEPVGAFVAAAYRTGLRLQVEE